jgi:cytochrome c-type biogenesis protein CcmH
MSQSMRVISAMLLGWMLCSSAGAVDDSPPLADPALQARYEKMSKELRCLVCQNEAISDSSATLAGDLRRELREQLMAGQSDAQILKFMTDRYGAFVLYNPPFEPRTWLLWLAPLLLLVVGFAIVIRVIAKRAHVANTQDVAELDEGNQA